MEQAQLAHLGLGEHTPALGTLMRLSQVLGIEFLVDVRPAQRTGPPWITADAERAEVVEAFATPDGGRLLVAAGQ